MEKVKMNSNQKVSQKASRAKDGISFTDRVLEVVSRIPKGETLSYGEVATRAGNPRAARAVGTIMRKNYRPDIPCHRVVRSDGTLGNYNRGGTEKKREILREEGALKNEE